MKHSLLITLICLLLIGLTSLSTPAEEAKPQTESVPEFSPSQLEFFEKSIRPLLAEHCYACHSGRAKRLEGGLRLDSRPLILKGGDSGSSVDLKSPHTSLMLEAVRYESFEMPPDTRLKQKEIDLLTRWVEMGLPWPDEKPPAENPEAETFDLKQRRQAHWAWKPLKPVSPPPVKNQSWSRHPVDQFILATLEAKQLAPAKAADKRTIIRRLYFDLIGLPPTPDQIKAFLDDSSPQAMEKVVDQLLASPQFGERWGRHWLDLMRYAESRGHEFDNDAPNAWQYRDYVIRALNADLPYDQFVTEHVAGDLLEQPRLNPESKFNESVLATAFWFLGEWVHSPVDIRKDETDRFDNAIDVLSKSFLGMTVSCARCHDHKFDAISTKDYYAFYGYLQSSNYHQVRFESMEHNRQLAARAEQLHQRQQSLLKAKLKAAFQDEIKHVDAYYQTASQLVNQEISSAELKQALQTQASTRQLNPGILQRWVQFLKNDPTAVKELTATIVQATNAPVSTVQSESFSSDNPQPANQTIIDYENCPPEDFITDGFSFGLTPRPRGTLLLNPADKQNLLKVQQEGAAVRDPLWDDLENIQPDKMNQKNKLQSYPRAGRTLRTPTFEVQGTVAYRVKGSCWVYACVDSHRLLFGPLHGSTLKKVTAGKSNQPVWITHDLSRYKGHRVHLEFTPVGKEPLEVYQVRHTVPQPESDLATVSLKNLKIQQAFADAFTEYFDGPQKPSLQSVALLNWMLAHPDLLSDPESKERKALSQAIQDYQSQRQTLKQQVQNQSRTAMAIMDGSAENDHVLIRGSHQNPGPLVERRFLEALNGTTPTQPGSGRLELARQINAPANPLTHRVIVNRIWAHLFGRGIVPSVDNFGVLGERPSHPELLDFLALQFLDQGRSLKKMIKYLVLTQTYQQASQTTLNVSEIDPDNIYLHRMPLKRLEGEVIRDALLSISGRIDLSLHGPSIPVHLTKFMDGRGKPPVNGPLDGNGRRSIYIQVRRNFLSPMMLAYDTPSPFSTMGRRNVSNVPAQALIMMNDPFVIQQANLWGKRIVENPQLKTDQDRIRWMYESALGRLPTPDELQAAEKFLQSRKAGIPDAAQQQIWRDLGHVIFNLKEFIYIF